MYIDRASQEQINVEVGDVVSIQGNIGKVTEVIRGKVKMKSHPHYGKEYVDVRVHFSGYLSEFGQYQDQVYGLFYIEKKKGE